MKVVIIPGMGCTPVSKSNWYGWFRDEIEQRTDRFIECVLRDFPDPYGCRESIWIPFLQNEIGIDESTIVVGHSSGAACAMRLLEQVRVKGAILVAAAHTDLGVEAERASEYYCRPWDWERMKQNTGVIHLFHGEDDHLIPVKEARHVAEMLKGNNFEYQELPGQSHLFHPFQEILDVMDSRF